MKKHYRHESDCLNCESELQGHYCHICGQENLHIREPFWHFLSHSISHYFHFDEKFFSTLKPLLTKPGYLTREYLDGKRTRFLHPVSMYIFISIVYFLVIPHFEPKEKDVINTGPIEINTGDDDAPMTKGAADTIAKAKDKLKNVYMGGSKVNNLVQTGLSKAAIKAKEREKIGWFKQLPFAEQTNIVDKLTEVSKTNKTDSIKYRLAYFSDIHIAREDSTIESYDKRQLRLADDDRDNWFQVFVKHKEIIFKQKTNKDWDFKKEFEHYQPKLYFILMPLCAFFLMLNFRKNHKYYVEHIVFTIHLTMAFFIFQLFVVPLNHLVFGESFIIKVIAFWVIAWYVYRALRVFYERTPWATIRKMATLFVMYTIAFSISVSIISAIIYLNAYLSA